MAHVELIGLRKSFAGNLALQDLELSIDRGELVSLLGPSGCGKTTTLRIIAGFETPDSGVIRVDGQNLLDVAPHLRAMGVVFQSYALFPHLTAGRNIAFGMKMAQRSTADIRRRVPELLELVGLRDAESKYPHEMSGGQQQRIALARALAIEPRMLLLDEPLSALDAVVRVSLRDEIRRIQTTLSLTTLYITHDQEEALAISDRVAVMRNGRIEQIGTPKEIYAQPTTQFVAGFIGKMNQLQGRVLVAKDGVIQSGPHRILVPPPALAGLCEGDTATVLVRPESVTIAPGDATSGPAVTTGQNRLVAVVEGVTFLGSVLRVALIATDHRIVADVPATASSHITRGDSILLSFPIEACRIIAGINVDRSLGKSMEGGTQ